jgi:chlorobactene glucosyltransferase
MTHFLISTSFFLLGLAIIYWLHTRYHLDIVVAPAPIPVSAPLISVCVPARNEERVIRRCVEAILSQNYPNFETLVVDDHSTDATAAILGELAHDHPNLIVIPGTALPLGWAGKPFAIYQAATKSRGEWLCFVDADTFLAPEALTSCYVKALDMGADLFTIMTHQILDTFWEKVLMPLVMTALSVGFSPRRVNDPNYRDAVANGQFILINRNVYQIIGSHERIKDQIVEDKAIAELVKWSGFRLVIADGRKLARTRMYTSPAIHVGGLDEKYLSGLA